MRLVIDHKLRRLYQRMDAATLQQHNLAGTIKTLQQQQTTAHNRALALADRITAYKQEHGVTSNILGDDQEAVA